MPAPSSSLGADLPPTAVRRLSLLLLLAAQATAQDLPDAVVFDDFAYASAAWQADGGADPAHNAGSLFGWNAWHTALDGAATVPDRLWYRGYSWVEPFIADTLYGVVLESATPGTTRGAAVLRAPAGYTGPPDGGPAQVEINAGFMARQGTWAARVNFSDLRDVRGMMQSFWAMSMNTAVVRSGGRMEKQRSEIDHELHNWFHFGWRRAEDRDRGYAGSYASDQGGVFDETGYYEAGETHIAPMTGPPGPDGRRGEDEYHCTVVRNARTTLRLSPATCAALMMGQGPLLAYGLPVLTGDLAVDLLMANADGAARFALRAAWTAPSPDGTETDRYLLRMEAPPHAPGLSQPMSARFSQYVMTRLHRDVDSGDRPLLRDHDFLVDWFYYSPDADLDLAEIDRHVGAIRAAGVPRLNTLGRPVHRPAVTTAGAFEWDEPAAAYINRAPERVGPGETARFEGSYAHRPGDIRATWTVRERRRGQARSRVTEARRDAWLRTDLEFPSAPRGSGGVESVVVGLEIEEYAPEAYRLDWEPMSGARASRAVEYRWDGRAWRCTSCAAARDPR